MARITVEDCVKHITNRFTLVLTAAERARKLTSGEAQPLIERGNHKDTVVALYEIAAGYSFEDSADSADGKDSQSGSDQGQGTLRTPFSNPLL